MRSEACYRWDVCEPVSGDVVAQVTLDPNAATLTSVGDNAEAIEIAERAVRGFADQALGITIAD